MLYFPQLSTGSCAQFPIRRTSVTRTVLNRLPDQSAIRLADPDARAFRWNLRYQALSDEERSALEELFHASAGPLRTFVFLDPADNLLRWSEDLSQDIWRRDGLIQVSDGRLTNTAQIMQGVEQEVPGPGWYRYCFSASVRGGLVRLALVNEDGEVSTEARAGGDWQHVWCAGEIPGSSDAIRCTLSVEPGASVQVRNMMLAPQPMPASYRPTGLHSGVYPSTRFADDRLAFSAEGPELHSVDIHLISSVGRERL